MFFLKTRYCYHGHFVLSAWLLSWRLYVLSPTITVLLSNLWTENECTCFTQHTPTKSSSQQCLICEECKVWSQGWPHTLTLCKTNCDPMSDKQVSCNHHLPSPTAGHVNRLWLYSLLGKIHFKWRSVCEDSLHYICSKQGLKSLIFVCCSEQSRLFSIFHVKSATNRSICFTHICMHFICHKQG